MTITDYLAELVAEVRRLRAELADGPYSHCTKRQEGGCTMLAENERLRAALHTYGTHEDTCPLGNWQGGEPSEKGYRMKYGGKWYYGDDRPKCTCGLDDAEAALAGDAG